MAAGSSMIMLGITLSLFDRASRGLSGFAKKIEATLDKIASVS
jgi:hypothetical protein